MTEQAVEVSPSHALMTRRQRKLYDGFRMFIQSLGGSVGDMRFDADGVVEIVIHWPTGYQILSPRTAHKGQ